MPTFKYKARKFTGESEAGVLEAPNQDSAINILQQKGLIVLAVSKTERTTTHGGAHKQRLHSGVSSRDILLFTTQLAATLQANIPLLKCLEIQVQQTTSRKFRVILEDIKDHVRQGGSLKDSIAKYPKIFGSMWVQLIETGEASGQLAMILEHMAEYLQSSAELKRKTVTALIYPSILISVCILAIYIFTVKIIPIFSGIFKDFGLKLPFITQMVINVSDFLKNNVLVTIIVVGGSSFALYSYVKTEKGERIFDALVYKIPIFGNFILNSAIEKFASSLSILIHSGIPILQALDIVARTSTNKTMEDVMKNAYVDVRDGKSLSSALAKSAIMPPLAVSMCGVGEETGELDKMLGHLTKYYKEEINVFVERLSATLEPLVIVVMGGIVFVLVLAMYLPIFQIALLGGGKK